jgi:hypothetical protein
MIVMLLSVTMVNIGITQQPPVTETKIYIDPRRIPEDPETLGHPGDEYLVSVMVDKVEDLWAVGFTIQFAKYGKVLVASDVKEGPFLSEDGTWPTFFVYKVSVFEGTIDVAITRLAQPDMPTVGVSGSGTLVTFKFTVIEVGNSPVDLVDTVLLDSNLEEIIHNSFSSAYYGVTAELVRMYLYKRNMSVGETQVFYSKVKNEGDLPLMVMVRFDNIRLEDGAVFTFYAGQAFTTAPPRPDEYLYVDSFTFVSESFYEWTTVGDAPWLDAINDTNLIYTDTHSDVMSKFGFQNITLGDSLVKDVWVEGYTKADSTAIDCDVYDDEISYWFGSLWGTDTWEWHGVRWVDYSMSDEDPTLLTEEGINGYEVLVHYWVPSDLRPSAGNFYLDALRLKVEFYPPISPVDPPIYVLDPGETLELDPASWVLRSEDIGKYVVTATVWFSYSGTLWNRADMQMTRTWWVTSPPY